MKNRKTDSVEEESTIDKRPWLMDWLFEIGQDIAIINHCNEKIQYLQKDIANNEGDYAEIDKIAEKINALESIIETAYESYDVKMSYIFMTVPGAVPENRCLLKHGCYKITLAEETYASQRSAVSKQNLDLAFKTFVGSISMALGIEFKECMRCLYDGIKTASDEAGENKSGAIMSIG